jgi:sulfite dehydrogenase (quinone) subunit SoeA
MEGVEHNTVWTWNAIGKQSGAWGLKPEANEATKGFLMNHLIRELLPRKGDAVDNITNSDPVTGQAAWYDLRVKITPAAPGEEGTWPTFDTIKRLPNVPESPDVLRYQAHQAVNLERDIMDVLTRGEK